MYRITGRVAAGLSLVAGLSLSGAVLGCASCGCTLSPDWDNLSFSASTGLKLDLRYDYVNQDQLRSGTGTLSAAEASRRLNRGDPQEVERYTRNNYYTLGLDYSVNRDWGISLQVPYIDRSHTTLGEDSDGSVPVDGGGQYHSHTSSPGDVKLIGRYQGFSPERNIGVLFGVKLPTGSYTRYGTSTDPTEPDPVLIDRGLQPGTGTTDLIVGAYYTGVLNKDWDYFGQFLLQTAVNSRDHYRPGDGINLNTGVRYFGFTDFTPQLQLNARHVERDVGANADVFSTGGTLAYLSPGVSVPVNRQTAVYGFVQLPVYQDVNGVQLAPRYTASLGVRFTY